MRNSEVKPFNFNDTQSIKAYLMDVVAQQIERYPPSATEYRNKIADWIGKALDGTSHNLSAPARQALIREVLAELIGYGPIQPLLEDPGINEVMVYGPNQVYIEREGHLEDTPIKFDDEAHVIRVINRMLHPVGRQVSIDNPTADARLPDGSRVNVVIPPISVDGPCITVRRFLKDRFTMEQLIRSGSLNERMANMLEASVIARLSIVISGNTSSGKTTLMNVLSSYIPDGERIVVIEDAAELKLQQKYTVRLETRPANTEGKGQVTTRDLVRNALRMRPDRLVIGEVRGEESLDLLQAMNTGHDGSLTTLHANSPRDALSRIETMALMAGLNLPLSALRQQIASAIDLIVHMDRLSDGSRKITLISEVSRMEGEVITLLDLFRFEQTGLDERGKIIGTMRATGMRPSFMRRVELSGHRLRADTFWAGSKK
ncbi:MAG: CpaF family protein [Anaerolineae bacterium]|nr:CpaF family protein [Anaerolineae bacterium]